MARLQFVVRSAGSNIVRRPVDGESSRPRHHRRARITGAAIRKAAQLGVSAVVAGGIDDQDLKEILGYDLGVAVTGTETIGTTVIITEGFGDIAMARRTFDLLRQHAGKKFPSTGRRRFAPA